LPPDHPDIGQAAPSQLPEGHPEVTPGGQPADGKGEHMPSLEPLPAGSTEERVEQKYKNIQLLKGLPAERLMDVMFSFRTALGVDCTHCHIKDEFEKDVKPAKLTARKMIQMMREVNDKLGQNGRVTCYTCHRGQVTPAN
jgi:hypothetical protein